MKNYLLAFILCICGFSVLSVSATEHHSNYSASGKRVHYKTVVDAALASPDLSTLVTALKAADLVSALQGSGPFLVFAPTNKAFKQLPSEVLTKLLQPANKAKLQAILKHHVMSGNTLEGHPLYLKIHRVGHAHVLKMVRTGNGVVYVIDRVLLPRKK